MLTLLCVAWLAQASPADLAVCLNRVESDCTEIAGEAGHVDAHGKVEINQAVFEACMEKGAAMCRAKYGDH